MDDYMLCMDVRVEAIMADLRNVIELAIILHHHVINRTTSMAGVTWKGNRLFTTVI